MTGFKRMLKFQNKQELNPQSAGKNVKGKKIPFGIVAHFELSLGAADSNSMQAALPADNKYFPKITGISKDAKAQKSMKASIGKLNTLSRQPLQSGVFPAKNVRIKQPKEIKEIKTHHIERQNNVSPLSPTEK